MKSTEAITSKGNLLVVDDNQVNLKLLTQILSKNGYKVRVAPSGKFALNSCQSNPPDLILLDINMPEMNGYEVCQHLKASKQTRNIPVIFISALDEAINKVNAFTVGGVDYITKPFEPLEVLARIENQLRLRELQLQMVEQNTLLQQHLDARRQAEVETRLLLATTQAISRHDDVRSALQAVLRLVCMTIQWDYGEAWIPDDNKVLECSQAWYGSEVSLFEFKNHSLTVASAPNVGFQGRIWASKQAEWIEDVFIEKDLFIRYPQIVKFGLKSSFGVPIILDNEVLAILIFFNKNFATINSRIINLVAAVATQLASLIQRKQTKEILRITQERYHSIVENAVEGIYQTTPCGRYLSANLALAKIYGYDSPPDLMTSLKNVEQQLYVDPNRRRDFSEAMEANHAVLGFESQVYRKDGKIIWISENARAVRDSKGKLLYYEGTVSDITARKIAQQQTEKLLLNILPKPIAERLQKKHQVIADSFSDVSVMFADLAGFTDFASHQSPTELVEILNHIFSDFDLLSKQHGLEKIKTIGDAYMVVGGLPIPRLDHVEATAQMALDMQAALARFNAQANDDFRLRIGINIGPVVAGVIGLSKFSYDLWGDTVNVASRMESSGIPGETQVTAAVYERLKEKFIFKERGTVLIKGKGEMKTYFLLGRK
ncbi:response regulator [Trichocoleus sp. FACHB-90]|uniref:adenylate/guanylate cyclase domain-containing protein n=1 Tax=Cyanophyceae TaxID=3028117 RepID=UPI00168336A8|nr:adenylate/guanylate cyclase domain-containing protein [Trichocoleus sp. FACHB-90]MBD1927233.1 response regulator [Trichocoleus sp. FACHB-90]